MEATRGTILILALALVPLAGCVAGSGTGGTTTDTTGEAGDGGKTYDGSSTTNDPGQFTYSGGVGHKTETETYRWTNPAPSAQVAWSGGVHGGAFTLTIEDAAGLVVYEQTISENEGRSSYESTLPGLPGPWTITFDFKDFSGGMSLSIQSR